MDSRYTAKPTPIHLKDYRPPDYRVDHIALRFELDEDDTRVHTRIQMRRSPTAGKDAPLVLNGQPAAMTLDALGLNETPLGTGAYRVEDQQLTIPGVPETFVLDIHTRLQPNSNTALEGLYMSNGMFCTQCEAEGFRRITWFPDRPDVMARYSTTIIADRTRYPVLLSNGNPMDAGMLEDNRHWVRWEDPFPKPSYLFALVAGDLVCIEDTYRTLSGRDVTLRLYVEPPNADKCAHAMTSLKQAMAWDERTFGLEYDLDIYMIVAVDHFNMGAMENKGLNVFNSKYVLARPDTATDMDYLNIQGVIGHEYFHNWTGNRVTCRDWFQLSLKEGLTVFRDQEFSADMNSRAVKRIQDVRYLRTAQFAEDSGPLAHPVRPESYIEINNFYTLTVYEKGAELVRMIHTLLGHEAFRRGMDVYFQRHDGQAVTTDDFVQAMADAGGVDLTQFQLWYRQAGTPELRCEGRYDPNAREYRLTVTQITPPTPGQPEKQPLHIPLAMGLLEPDGAELPLQLHGEDQPTGSHRVLNLRREQEVFRFVNVPAPPVPSLLRGFSAPVNLKMDYTDEELAFLMAHDSDAFNRWEAGQRLATRSLLELVDDVLSGRPLRTPAPVSNSFLTLLNTAGMDKALLSEALQPPSEHFLGQQMDPIQVDAIHAARVFLRRDLARSHREALIHTYQENRDTAPYRFQSDAIARRSMKNLSLSYLMELNDPEVRSLCLEQLHRADNMTDTMAALNGLANTDCPERTQALQAFYRRWRNEPLVIDKWFSIQATSRLPGTLETVKRLMEHPDFDITNPNRVRSLVGTFCHSNAVRFHDPSGSGYRFLSQQVLRLDPVNPQVAARLLGAITRWRRYDKQRQTLMQQALKRVLSRPALSPDVYEVASRSLEKP